MTLFAAKSNKRGNAVIDGATLVVLFVIFGLGSIFAYMVFDQVNDDIISEFTEGSQAKTQVENLHGNFPKLMDGLFLFAFILFTIFVIASVFLLDTHPIFFVVSLVMLIAVFISGMLLSNAFDDIMQDGEIATYAESFPFITWIMGHLVEMIVAIGFLTMLALFAKYKT